MMSEENEYKYDIIPTSRFKKDLDRVVKRNLDTAELNAVVTKLAKGETLEEKYHDHSLSGKYAGYRDCHIQPNWILVYRIVEQELVLLLYRTGTHSDLFE